jgi:predicted lysophospholipase L1 biosynthesis ABC-type transport system permease subunit
MPQAFLLSDKPQWDLTVEGPDPVALREALQELWKAHGPPLVYDIQSVDEQRAEVYRQERQLTSMLDAVAILAVGIAMVGAYALVADTLNRRRTELVLRRLHGAGHADIAREIAAEFASPLLIAGAVGLPISAWLGQRYLGGFVDRVDPPLGLVSPLIAAALLTVIITALAAMRHVKMALELQPIESLR